MVDEIDETLKYQRGLSRFPPVWVTMIMVKVSSPSSLSFPSRCTCHLIFMDFSPPYHGLRGSFIFQGNFIDGGTPDEMSGVFLNVSAIVENTFLTFLPCGKQKKYIFENLVQERYATCMILFLILVVVDHT